MNKNKILETLTSTSKVKEWLSKNTGTVLICAALVFIIIIESFFHSSLVYFVEKKVVTEIKNRSIPLVFKSLDYGYLPPRLIVKDAVYSAGVNSAEIETGTISVKILPLIKLKLVPSTLYLKKPKVTWSLPKVNKKNNDESSSLNFQKILDLFPLSKAIISEGDLNLSNKNTTVKLKKLDLEIEEGVRSLKLDLSSFVEAKHGNFSEMISVNFNTNLEEDSIYIKFLNLQKENSILKVTGSLKTKDLLAQKQVFKDIESIYEQINELSINTQVNLTDFNETLKYFSKSQRDFKGNVQTTGYFNQNNEDQSSRFNVNVSNLVLPKLKLFSAKIGGEISTSGLDLKDGAFVEFKEGSRLNIESAHVESQSDGYWTNFIVKSKTFLLEDLLHSLNIPNKSFNSPMALNSKCRGSLNPVLALSCDGELDIKKFILTLKDSPFLDLNRLKTPFELKVGKKELSFSSQPIFTNKEQKSYTGEVSGNIHYVKGFNINYESPSFDLGFMNSIANQKLRGIIKAKGQTEGSSRWAKFFVDVKEGKQMKYNDFYLSNAETTVSYKYPNLKASNVTGYITDDDDYNADFTLNTDTNLMRLTANGTNFTNTSITKFFADSFNFPEGVTFNNSNFKFSLDGPTDIEKANLTLINSVPAFTAFGEVFGRSRIELKGENGKWSFHNTNLNRKDSTFAVEGDVVGFKEIDIKLTSLDSKLEEINLLSSLKTKISGPAIIKLEAKGPISGPKAFGRIQLKDTKDIRGLNLGNSDIGYRIYEDQVSFKGEAFNKKIVGDGIYPLNSEGDAAFKGKFDNFDLFRVVEFKIDDSSAYSLNINLVSDFIASSDKKAPLLSGWFDQVNIDFKNASQSILNLKNYETILFENAENGFVLTSYDSHKASVFIKTEKNNKSSIFTKINGLIEASALQGFIPQTDILRGLFNFNNVEAVLSRKSFNCGGLVKYTNGTFKNSSFPYSFTDINTILNLKGNKITFDKIDARINNSPVFAKGYLKLFPFYLNTDFNYEALQIDYPTDIISLSDGAINISGDSLPLKAAGTINVKSGEFKKDLLSGEDGKTITANKFLPETILYKNSPPFVLDVGLNIGNNYKVNTSEITGKASGFLKLKGNAFNPVTKGSINLKPGMKLNFLDKTFSLKEGRLIYSSSYIDNPNLYIDAKTEVFDNNDITSSKYMIRMLVEGAADNLKFSFNSTPSLAEKEIISLLTLGTISTQAVGQEITTQQQATHQGLQVGSFLLQKNKGIQELQKKTGTEIGIGSSVDAYNVNPKVQLKKKWSPKLSSTVSQSFGNQQVLSLSTEYKVNQKVSTSLNVQNNQTQDATQLLNRQVQQGEIFGLDLQYKFEFE